ncbi:class I SAM-dependent methyltransferase [Ancylobacter oerskovii]|uniref:Class I SAM-dependent methyltransferase n=1 Tax=Ancylobacter oerskovii TaxID=459519 RepID=A0ABW4Z0S5_9HYPH|nr:class I SAM-dependent methyltransferase [Ancylobacter oerskovii]MBS7542605.1 hypothetical protein [Ancylobacter oerskovii]
MTGLSRLEKTLLRLQSQQACLAWAFERIVHRTGPVIELGLGLGRTFDHLRKHLPGRDIYVFDRVNGAYAECQPDPRFLILGEIEETLPRLRERLAGRVVLANSDLGSFDRESNRRVAGLASDLLPPFMAPGGIVMSDLPLNLKDFDEVPVPDGASPDRYYLYRRQD